MIDYEKLGVFYLGRRYDLERRAALEEPLLYDSKDLTTHAVCIGMTGSGKTGLCLSLLEEAAIDGVPAIAVDPKGDLGNLCLTFPELRGDDFRPWVDQAEAARQNLTPDELAEKTATQWREGLASWGQSPERIARFRDAVDLAIYTPGSDAGLPLTVLRSLAAPPQQVLDDAEAMRDHTSAAASGLLALAGIQADAVRSREHILVARLLDAAWREGKSLDIAGLIRQIQRPPFEQVGVVDLETFYPASDRTELSMTLNNLLASPSFAGWMQGEPLDVKRLLHTPEGKPRLSIVSIAHLTDAERMFFLTILLNEVLAWVRTQSGTSSLRALLYIDEVFGYLPPTANPPTKLPLLTLLKQARAFGLGVVLATQNPVDLDYKGLSNTGTWLLGRLQTDRDKQRVLDGLEGVALGEGLDRAAMDRLLSSLDKRVFLMNNVHDQRPELFQTRWALSYLRGPLTRSQIESLMADRKPSQPPAPESQREPIAAASSAATAPLVPPQVRQWYLTANHGAAARMVYRPALLAGARLHFAHATYKVDEWQQAQLVAPAGEPLPDDIWAASQRVQLDSAQLLDRPQAGYRFAPLPAALLNEKSYAAWQKQLKGHLYRTQSLAVYKCAALKQYSHSGETAGDFRVRLKQLVTERRDADMEKLRAKYAKKLSTLQGRILTAEQRVEREKSQAKKAGLESVISLGTSILGALFGRKLASRTNVSKASTSMRSLGRAAEQRGDIGRAQESLQALLDEREQLSAELEAELEELRAQWQADALEIEEYVVRPKKTDLQVEEVSLLWTPWTVDAAGIAEPAYQL